MGRGSCWWREEGENIQGGDPVLRTEKNNWRLEKEEGRENCRLYAGVFKLCGSCGNA